MRLEESYLSSRDDEDAWHYLSDLAQNFDALGGGIFGATCGETATFLVQTNEEAMDM
eukprot:CAMPEP_0185760846 /NCGR_PEP_ID=MMETSP1174-20130828/19761_1 /TAXON_ID=35687 /ORGANISM="Dictyocha speculum, Strain CCMP1381" /LENGTH=56 /DNA_ID=CAMNT_0028441823 /DNA_START=51 /DNA_END=218 /DNA_ORIENTATION=-